MDFYEKIWWLNGINIRSPSKKRKHFQKEVVEIYCAQDDCYNTVISCMDDISMQIAKHYLGNEPRYVYYEDGEVCSWCQIWSEDVRYVEELEDFVCKGCWKEIKNEKHIRNGN